MNYPNFSVNFYWKFFIYKIQHSHFTIHNCKNAILGAVLGFLLCGRGAFRLAVTFVTLNFFCLTSWFSWHLGNKKARQLIVGLVLVDLWGFEPQITEPKSAVLPLHHRSVPYLFVNRGEQQIFLLLIISKTFNMATVKTFKHRHSDYGCKDTFFYGYLPNFSAFFLKKNIYFGFYIDS